MKKVIQNGSYELIETQDSIRCVSALDLWIDRKFEHYYAKETPKYILHSSMAVHG